MEMAALTAGAISPNGEALSEACFSDDMLRGAHEIAGFLFGDPKERRKVYYLAENSRLPTFKLGAVLCARKSTIMEWVKQQEAKAFRAISEEVPTNG
jgi:hypothetical protein